MELERDIIENDVAIAEHLAANRRGRRRRRRYWVKPWLLRRPLLGQYERLMHELRDEDLPAFRNFVRVEPAMFQELIARLGPRITKNDTWYRKALDPGLRLAITLRYLASGDSYRSLMYGFRVADNTISMIVRDVCQAIIDEYAEEVIACHTTPHEWRQIAEQFGARWNFHHTVGALDGKHIAIRCPRNGGSLYYNYKGFHSIVLMALVDADYKFIWVDVGANGSASDATVFNQSELKETIENGSIGFPAADPLPQDDRPMPYFIIADDAFPLRTWLMKPFSRRNLTNQERIFNYRLSRSRRIVENAFGILGNRFGCLLTTMQQTPKAAETIVLGCCCLHNIMRIRYPAFQNAALDQEADNHQVCPGAWRDGENMHDMDNIVGGNRTTRAAKAQRLYLTHYYNSSIGAVPWQSNMI
ncbi:MAG: transposase family protein [Candidatus Thiodiazotropha sp.]|nr:transposase family protein [Candidatus Thiodiazotropha sp.]